MIKMVKICRIWMFHFNIGIEVGFNTFTWLFSKKEKRKTFLWCNWFVDFKFTFLHEINRGGWKYMIRW
jgi:hypothetical protein